MAGLVSPGVQVQVIDESFYTPAEPGTIPMIFVASRENKANASATGIAQGTISANAGKPYLISSQRELADFFGDPIFEKDENNNMLHGSELNEYGLQAAYSYLGISNRAYIVRAGIDLDELQPTEEAPDAYPPAGTGWLDLADTEWGIQVWDGSDKNVEGGQTFSNKIPLTIYKTKDVADYDASDFTPKGSVGAIGSYAVVTLTDIARYWFKNTSGTWVEIGTPAWTASWPTIKSTIAAPTLTGNAGTIIINGTAIAVQNSDSVTTIATNINLAAITGLTASAVDGFLEIYSDGSSSGADDSTLGGPIVLAGDGADGVTKLGQLGLEAGTYYPPSVQVSRHVTVPEWKTTDTYSRPTGSVWLKTSKPNKGMNVALKTWNSSTLLWDEKDALAYKNNAEALKALDPTGGGINITAGVTYTKVNVDNNTPPLVNFRIYERVGTGATSITTEAITASSPGAATWSFTMSATEENKDVFSTPVTVSVTTVASQVTSADAIAEAINSANVPNVSAEVTDLYQIKISHALGGDIKFVDTDGVLTTIGFLPYSATNSVSMPFLQYVDGTNNLTSPAQYQATLWRPITYTASTTAPFAIAEQGQLWYSNVIDEVDLMYHDGSTWRGYRNIFPNTDPNGPQVRFSMPETQSDGTSPLVSGDIWISTADLDNYPLIYVYDSTILGTIEQKWGSPRDITDQSTEDGVLFDDARYGTDGGSTLGGVERAPSGTIAALLNSDYLDPDAPDPTLYPKGMLLWNLRRSGFNVRRFERNYINLNDDNDRYQDEDMSNYYPHRWVTHSANKENGAGNFGRFAQRKVIVTALQAAINNNEDIRDEEVYDFNLLATPGYSELNNEMISFNFDRNLTAFIVADTPLRLSSDTPSLQAYALNTANSPQDDEFGLLSRDEYMGVFYPAGFTSDNFGNDIVVPSSHMMLRTMSLNDQVAFPWFAPAGTRRGGITNASSTGFINNEGEFVPITLNNGQRDTLYENNINPITFISGSGLVAFGQKTRARNASALDRINVARLIIYMRKQLKKLAKPYLFEPNDKITRDEIKASAESLLLELVGNRALYDFLVVCDETNNTPARIDRNELYLDIAIEPVKAVEFIYIPLRIKNTGEIGNL